MKHRYHQIVAGMLGLLLAAGTPTSVTAADTGSAATAVEAVAASSSGTKKHPTKNPLLARRVLLAQGVVGQKQLTQAGLEKKVTRQQFAKMLVQLSAYKNKAKGSSKISLYSDVKRGNAYSSYIRIAVENGWMKGNLRGKFRPKQAIRMQEAAAAIVAVLGYTDSDFEGNLAAAKLSFFKAEKLNTNVKKKASAQLNMQDVCCLLYNMQVSETKSGSIYAGTLGYELDANGDIDYLALTYENLSGPVIASQHWEEQLPFSIKDAAIYIDGSKGSAGQIQTYDVLYYSKKQKAVFVYQNRVIGRLNCVSPDRYTPTSVTVGSKTYALGTQTAAVAASALGSLSIGDYVTLLLGRDDQVVGIVSAAQVNSFVGGIVLSKTEKVSTDKGAAAIKKYITMLDTAGETREYEVSDLTKFWEKVPVEVVFENGSPVVNKLTLATLNGTVSAAADSFAGYRLTDNIRILEYCSDGTYATMNRSRLAGMLLNSSNILYYHLNANKEITDLLLTDVTGDNYTYGILTSATELSDAQTNTYIGTYTYQIGDATTTTATDGQIFGMDDHIGPVQLAFSSTGALTGMQTLGSISVTSITQTEVSNGVSVYELAEDVSVYLRNGGTYYAASLDKVMDLGSYNLAAYYDHAGGGRIRVIIALKK